MTEKVITPFPPDVDPAEYTNLTQKQRMTAGYPYRQGDAELDHDHFRGRELLHKFNSSAPNARAERREILRDLFHPDSRHNEIEILPPLRVDYGCNVRIGTNVRINYDCIILDCAPITIGDNCTIGPSVHLYSATHPLDAKHRQGGDDYYELGRPINIGNNVWIGGRATICPGVIVGDNAIVEAGSVVCKNVAPNTVVAGNPATVFDTSIRKI